MNKPIFYCPHCGQPLIVLRANQKQTTPAPPSPPPTSEPGIIYASESAAARSFNLINIQDLDGMNADQRKALIYLRFKNDPAFADIEGYYFEEWEKYLPSLQENANSGQSQLERDLEAVTPYLDNIIRDGRFVYGYQSRIAEALNIPNEGSFRRRIKNVAAILAGQSYSTSTTAPTDPVDHDVGRQAA